MDSVAVELANKVAMVPVDESPFNHDYLAAGPVVNPSK
jgi:hypothetical protein